MANIVNWESYRTQYEQQRQQLVRRGNRRLRKIKLLAWGTLIGSTIMIFIICYINLGLAGLYITIWIVGTPVMLNQFVRIYRRAEKEENAAQIAFEELQPFRPHKPNSEL